MDEEQKNVERIKREILGESFFQRRPETREELKDKLSTQEAEKKGFKQESDELREEVKHLEKRVKDLFNENARLRAYVTELEGVVYKGEKKAETKKEAMWQKMLRRKE